MPKQQRGKSPKKPAKSTPKKAAKSVKKPGKKAAPKKNVKSKPRRSSNKTICNQQKQNLHDILMQCQEVDTLKHAIEIMQEQLGSYVLLGYGFDGTPITAIAATTPQQFDALQSRCVQFIAQSHGGGQAPRPPMFPSEDDIEE